MGPSSLMHKTNVCKAIFNAVCNFLYLNNLKTLRNFKNTKIYQTMENAFGMVLCAMESKIAGQAKMRVKILAMCTIHMTMTRAISL